MKAIGIVRKVDSLGRIVIPKEIRDMGNMEEGTPLEIYVDEEGQIILKKYEPDCIFCGEANDVVNWKGKNICKKCLHELRTKVNK